MQNTAADCVVIFQEPAGFRNIKNQVFSLAKEYLAVVVTKKDDSYVTLYQVKKLSSFGTKCANVKFILLCYFPTDGE